MNKIFLKGGSELNGSIRVSGSKNAALPIIAATLLTRRRVKLLSVPHLSDIDNMLNLLKSAGKDFIFKNGELTIFESEEQNNPQLDDLIFNTIRASCLVLGPILATHGKVSIKTPGGCAIGKRPIDLHLMALEKMGAKITINGNVITARAEKLKGALIEFPKVSVGATQNTMMASVLAYGETIIRNAACEPEVTDLAKFLVTIGAKIDGISTRELKITGVDELKGGKYRIIPDRIEAATYLTLLAAVGGKISLSNVNCHEIENFIRKLNETNAVKIECKNKRIIAEKVNEISPVDITTDSYPGFPTDLQPQFMALMCLANGKSLVEETIFEGRFMHIKELRKFGVNINVINNRRAVITGKSKLNGAHVTATDLRAAAALIIAGLSSNGETIVSNAHFINRGYEKIEKKLKDFKIHISYGDQDLALDQAIQSKTDPIIVMPAQSIKAEIPLTGLEPAHP